MHLLVHYDDTPAECLPKNYCLCISTDDSEIGVK